jgi:RNA polymerase sigma factor (sigma-70 family)
VTDTQEPELEKQISAELAERIGRGDRTAEQRVCERYYQRLLHFIRRRVGGDMALAEDICQQTFLKGLEKLRNREIKNPASLAAYLHGIAVKDVMNETRKSGRRATSADSELIDTMADIRPTALEEISEEQVRAELHRHLDRLSAHDRDVLIRLYLREESRESICASEGYSPQQFNNIVWRAKERLKKQLLEPADARRQGESKIVNLTR